jgi:hypothetical protein
MAKVKIVKKTLKDSNLAEMFNQMLGGDGDPDIVADKLKRVRGLIKTVALVTRDLATGPFRRDFPEYQEWWDDFQRFAERTEALAALEYKDLKDAPQTKHLVMVCSELVMYAHFLECKPPADRWIGSHPGLSFEIFAFTKFDIKHVWANQNMTPKLKQYLLQVISIMFNKCREVHRIISSPDVDVKKFSKVIVESIEKVKGMPELSRCSNAFNKIRDSVALLENNFSEYYKDMVQSENPNTLIENFIVDVSKGQNMNLSLMREFRTIINFYKKQSAGKIKDPKVKKLFDSLNSRMDMLEKKAKVQNGDAASEVAESSDDEVDEVDEVEAE